MSNEYTISIDDSLNLIGASTEAQLQNSAVYALELISDYVDWLGVLDAEIRIRPAGESPYDVDGIMPSIINMQWNGQSFDNAFVLEQRDGVDRDPTAIDAGATIYLSEDGTIKNYGMPVWFDPAPDKSVAPNIPEGHFDFIGVLVHEIFHGLGFVRATTQYQNLTQEIGGHHYLVGDKVQEIYGSPLPLSPHEDGQAGDHYGNDVLNDGIESGLLFRFGNYHGNRLDIGQVDLAVLEDMGYRIKTYEGLPLFDEIDAAQVVEQPAVSGRHELAERVALLYEAALDRMPDEGGLNYWFAKAGRGLEIVEIAGRFIVSEEFQKKYDVVTDQDFIEQLYLNVLDREAETSGRDYWLGQMGAGASQAQVLSHFASSDENMANATWLSGLTDTDNGWVL